MTDGRCPGVASRAPDGDRRAAVLQAALLTFARFGYRKTSMDQVARDADISRPGLYFLFETKQALFREAVERSLEQDLADVERALGETGAPLRRRLLHAFDHWAGNYIGPLTRDIATVVADNPDLLGPTARAAPERFARSITDAISAHAGRANGERIAATLLSTSLGIKHQVSDRQAYLENLDVALELLLRRGGSAL